MADFREFLASMSHNRCSCFNVHYWIKDAHLCASGVTTGELVGIRWRPAMALRYGAGGDLTSTETPPLTTSLTRCNALLIIFDVRACLRIC